MTERTRTAPIDVEYLPFAEEELLPHFTGDARKQVARFRQSADRYRSFLKENETRSGIPLKLARLACQIEKDETFWTATALKRVVDSPEGREKLATLLSQAFGPTPPLPQFAQWSECLTGNLHLILEAALPSPKSYLEWLRSNHLR